MSGWGKQFGHFGAFVSNVKSSVDRKMEEARIAKEAKAEGKIYDAETKEWKFYLLDEDMKEIEKEEKVLKPSGSSVDNSSGTGGAAGADGAERPVKDREYYDMLDISTNADAATIKKSYYKAARKCHPDKNPDDPQANEKFQKLGHAYQILSNEQARAHYDEHGIVEGDQAEMAASEIDPFVFFNVMFGSALVEPYIGELWIAQTGESLMNDKATSELMAGLEEIKDENEREKVMRQRFEEMEKSSELKQRKRQVKCALNLRERIQPYVDAASKGTPVQEDVEKYTTSIQEEAKKIAEGSYGALYCITIGYTLMVSAEEYLAEGNLLLGTAARAKQFGSSFGTNMKLVGATVKAASAGHRAMRQAESVHQRMAEQQQQQEGGEESKNPDQAPTVTDEMAAEAMAEAMDQTLPAILEFTWAINKRDIQTTLRTVFKKLMDDNTLSKAERRLRADAIFIFGREFYKAGKQAEAEGKKLKFEAEDIKARVAVATMATMAKAQGQDMSEDDPEELIRQAKQMSVQNENGEMDENCDETTGTNETSSSAATGNAKPPAAAGKAQVSADDDDDLY